VLQVQQEIRTAVMTNNLLHLQQKIRKGSLEIGLRCHIAARIALMLTTFFSRAPRFGRAGTKLVLHLQQKIRTAVMTNNNLLHLQQKICTGVRHLIRIVTSAEPFEGIASDACLFFAFQQVNRAVRNSRCRCNR
jgi:hypothetical protein